MSNPATPTPPLPKLLEFLKHESSAGLILMGSALLALIVANSPLADGYFHALHVYIGGLSVLHWINDGLMALFFLLVGLEIKREMLEGQLSSWGQRILPGFAALGGMIVPALIYVACTQGDSTALRGWAIPMATDIAFALGVLTLLGSRVPASLKVFLAALAIIDDLGAVIVIALFYTEQLSMLALGGAAAVLAVLIALNVFGVKRVWIYLLLGVLLWFFVLKSGVHATLAGVMLALTVPLREKGEKAVDHADHGHSPLHRLEHGLHPWSAFLVIPIFGFANAGVSFAGMSPHAVFDAVPLGIIAGLFIGKQLGVLGFTWLAIATGRAQRPAQASWMQLYGVALLCGIGFTMSLFIGGLAFGDGGELMRETKLGVLGGSVLSALAGVFVLRFLVRAPR
ncbi:Na+/H+ antiporter NhaA [Solimonas marina]|uniref:Na(+)/H(+) antiporter NhaA n=1 Tax=Solimonas marina TaxID=2714601 RepID=A0A969W8S1_9GAMM|nr:Na+/H+ antiporter NhaA [Solimonas marina]NKF22078.1 Na+/H+ antiporter NhaA [Solimonas marina]